jgi:hypothetical protein
MVLALSSNGGTWRVQLGYIHIDTVTNDSQKNATVTHRFVGGSAIELNITYIVRITPAGKTHRWHDPRKHNIVSGVSHHLVCFLG